MSPSRSTNHDPQGPDPQQRRLLRVCRIGRAQGLKGEVNVYAYTDEPERRFAPGSQLQTNDGQTFTVVSSRRFKQRWIILFQGVADRNAAEVLNGLELYVQADPAEELAQEDAWYPEDLIGLKVRMAPGNSLGEPAGRVVGQVSDVLDGVAQQQLQIRMTTEENDDDAEGLIPFVEALVPQVDIENGYVTINPPGGLLPGLG